MHCKHRAEHRYAESCANHAGGIDETRCGAGSGRRHVGHCHRIHRSDIETEPAPHSEYPLSISTRLSLNGIRASMSRPSPISPMPAVMGTRGPSLLAMRPESCDVTM